MDAAIAGLIDFVSANRQWAFWIALVFAAAETTAFLSIAIPSTAILVGVGAVVATGSLDFGPIWAGAAIGSVIGSTFSWWLGLRYGTRILGMWPLRNNPDLVARANASFARWGVVAILVGHFFGGLRPVVFLMAGISRMPVWQFHVVNVLGSIAWAYAVPKSGEIGGNVFGALWRLVTGG